jgi:hypothetical protein
MWTIAMLAFGLGLKLFCAVWALAWAGWVLVRGQRTPLHLSWGVFTLSMGALLVAEGLGDSLGSARLWLLMLSGGTCSVFWLFTRALFRKTAAIGPFELMLVAGIIAPSMIKPVLIISGFSAPIEILVNAQTMLSSTALMLSVWEAARNWPSAEHLNERRLRIGYLTVFSSGVFLCAIVFNTGAPISPQLVTLIEALCATAILAVGSVAIVYRRAHPAPDWRPAPQATETDTQLGQRLIRLIDREQTVSRSRSELATSGAGSGGAAQQGQPRHYRRSEGRQCEPADQCAPDRACPKLAAGSGSGFADHSSDRA